MRSLACLFLPLSLACAAAQAAAVGLASSSTVSAGAFGTPVTNNPVSLVAVRTRTQTLADGTHIIQKTREMYYRDSQGRTRTEAEFPAAGMNRVQIHSVSVYDPVAGKSLTWTEIPSATRKEYFARSIARPALMADAPQPAPLLAAPTRPASRMPDINAAASRPQVQHEDLGIVYVQGFACKADRTITIYPIDFFSNDRPITATEERCISRELGRTLQETRDDPRSGVSALAIESLSRGEPAATLFQPPAGYTERPVTPTVAQP